MCAGNRPIAVVGPVFLNDRKVQEAEVEGTRRRSASQREEPFASDGRTHAKRHQADLRFGRQRWSERQPYEVQPTSACVWAVSLLGRLLPCREHWRYWRRLRPRGQVLASPGTGHTTAKTCAPERKLYARNPPPGLTRKAGHISVCVKSIARSAAMTARFRVLMCCSLRTGSSPGSCKPNSP